MKGVRLQVIKQALALWVLSNAFRERSDSKIHHPLGRRNRSLRISLTSIRG